MTRVLIDACVLYPSVLRGILLDCAKAGLFEPVWSDRIIEEWRYAAYANGIGPQADIEIALVKADWRRAMVEVPDSEQEAYVLADENDRHVIAAAVAGKADALLTANTKDFPLRILTGLGLLRRHPDEFLLELANAHGAIVAAAIERVHTLAETVKGDQVNRRKMLQKTGLPRLAKWDMARRD